MLEFYTSGCVPLPGGIREWIQLLQSGSVGRHKSKYLVAQTLLITINYHNSP